MTRINLVSPKYLTNRHLVAEYKEIRRISSSLKRSLNSKSRNDIKIPDQFTLGTGHVTFFYDKGAYIFKRFLRIQSEMTTRGFRLNADKMHFDTTIFHDYNFFNDWTPTEKDLKIVCKRIKEKLLLKPDIYKDKQRFLDYCDLLKI